MSIFLTGATGFLGSYVVTNLLRSSDKELSLLIRAKDEREAWERLWKSLQLHMEFEEFQALTKNRVQLFKGDLVSSAFGLPEKKYKELASTTSSVLHIAASLNRKSDKSCFNVNLRGTLEVIKLAQKAEADHGLERFSEVSTVAVAGVRKNESVLEDEAVDWSRSDYDPYARTKKFSEHMIHELLPNVRKHIFRPSTVMGDENRAETTQFDMVRAFVTLSDLPIIPLSGDWRMDIVPANYVGEAIARIHLSESSKHEIYNLSSGIKSPTYQEIVTRLQEAGISKRNFFVPQLRVPFQTMVSALDRLPRRFGISRMAAMLKVFLPYLSYNTVFPNERVVEEMGREPRPFVDYAVDLYRFAKSHRFKYPYKPWPEEQERSKVA